MPPKADPTQGGAEVQMEAAFDVTGLSVSQLEQFGVIIAGAPVVVERGAHRLWMSHSEFLSKKPVWDQMQRSAVRRRWIDWDRARRDRIVRLRAKAPTAENGAEMLQEALRLETRELEGFRMHRTFPCLGVLRVEEIDGASRIVQCDKCGDRFGVGAKPEDAEPAEKSESGERYAEF